MRGIVSFSQLLALSAVVLLCAGLPAAEIRIPQNGDFAAWGPAVAAEGWTFAGSEGPLNWIPVVRTGVTGSMQRVPGSRADGADTSALALSGRILSKQVYPGYRGKVMRVSLRARGEGGRIAVYLRECDSAENRQVKFVAIAIDGPTTADWKEYSGVVEMTPYHNDDAVQLDLEGHNVQLEQVRLDVVGAPDAGVVKAPEVICTLPKIAKIPVINGEYTPEEWSNGVRFDNGFMDITTGQAIGDQTACSLLSDGTTLYLAFLAPVPKNGLRTMAAAHDDEVWADDCMELYVNPGYAAGTSETVYQIVVNFAGTTFDVAHKISIGQTEQAWTCDGLIAKAGQYQGRAVLEIALPGKSVGLSSLEQVAWGLNVCRSLHAAKQNASLTGGAYNNFKRMMRCQVVNNAPAIRWGFSGTPNEGHLVLGADLFNATATPLPARVQLSFVDGPEQQEAKKLTLAPGAYDQVQLDLTGQTNDHITSLYLFIRYQF